MADGEVIVVGSTLRSWSGPMHGSAANLVRPGREQP